MFTVAVVTEKLVIKADNDCSDANNNNNNNNNNIRRRRLSAELTSQLQVIQ